MRGIKLRLIPFHASSYTSVASVMDTKRQTSGSSGSDVPSTPTSPISPHSLSGGSGHDTMVALCRSVIPPLCYSRHKGEAGRIAIVGGCEEYTGAPYYAAISALKVGGDLSHIFCTQAASTAIKSYSPELIVHPLLDAPNAADKVSKWLPRLHVLVIGPGLGLDEHNLATAKAIASRAKRMRIPLVIDANGIDMVMEDPSIVKGYKGAILTPNVAEFNRLYQQLKGQKPDEANEVAMTIELSKALDNITIVRKGPTDIICTGDKVVTCSVEGSPRRCGGQGDVLSGSMGTFLHWATVAFKTTDSYLMKAQGLNITAAYMACALTRECNRRTFDKHRRASTTTQMIDEIGFAFESLFEQRDS